MNIKEPKNKNYCATVVSISNIIPLEGCDNVVGTSMFGFQAIIGKDHKVGDIGIIFPAETQLTDKFCSENNLYRHSELNKDKSQKGYLEDNRRVKAMKFRGQVSSCLFMPLESLKFTGVDISKLEVGMEFDEINDISICRKYLVKEHVERSNKMSGQKKKEWVEAIHMPEHFDTDNFWKNIDKVGNFSKAIITQKLHGTSIRVGNTITNRDLTLIEKIAKYFGAKIQEKEYDYVFASRKVIKDQDENKHFYETDIWTEEGEKLRGLLPKNYILYGELIGWTKSGQAIQKGYTYNVPQGEAHLYIYRIAVVNEDGFITDLCWDDIKQFCNNTGLKYVPEIEFYSIGETTEKITASVNSLMDCVYSDTNLGVVKLSDEGTVDEGVCVRFEGERSTPYILKAKAPKFFEHETKLLDTNEEDLESTQS